jgi:hypothetical protein
VFYLPANDGGYIREAAVGLGPESRWHILPDEDISRPRAGASEPRAEFVAPLVINRKTAAIAAYGLHGSGASLDPDEMASIRRLVDACGPIIGQSLAGVRTRRFDDATKT